MNKKQSLTVLTLGFAALGGLWFTLAENSKTISLGLQNEVRPLSDIVHEEQEQKLTTRENIRTSTVEKLKTERAGASFREDKTPPVERVVEDPELGKVVEITYADGTKLYRPNDPVYNWETGELSQPIK